MQTDSWQNGVSPHKGDDQPSNLKLDNRKETMAVWLQAQPPQDPLSFSCGAFSFRWETAFDFFSQYDSATIRISDAHRIIALLSFTSRTPSSWILWYP